MKAICLLIAAAPVLVFLGYFIEFACRMQGAM